jgi:acyl-CoA synthetase (NDP forming)
LNLGKEAPRGEKTALNEKASKDLLKTYGIPVVEEIVCPSGEEAVEAAGILGYPVVLKGMGPTLLHKTERGLVRLNLKSSQEILDAARGISANAAEELEAFLVQPMVDGNRELTAGMFRDEQFGPVVMFGLGGIFAEALSDVSFRIAPLTESDAGEMLAEIRSSAILGAVRGESPIDRSRLVAILTGLSRMALECPEIAEVDINPIRVTSDGRLWAVDALVVKAAPQAPRSCLQPVDPDSLGNFFHPKSIAFVGASGQIGKWGHMLPVLTKDGGYAGDIYMVNPKGGVIVGEKAYPAIADLPEKVHLAVVTVPAARVLDLIPQLREKGIRNMLLISSGFGETGSGGKNLEKQLVEKAGQAGILMVGPNTMGICNPHISLYCTGSPVRPIAGSTAMVSQSGNMGTQLLAFAELQGIGIRAFCGSGNEGMITIEDFMEAFEVDPLTRTVMLYIESVKNGRRFFESAHRLGKKKPIVLLKGGCSAAGNRAASSHTGALASDIRIFDAGCRQSGIVKVDHPMDLLDLSAAFSALPLPSGNRVGIMTLGGGWGVVTADLCSAYGLTIPELPKAIVEKIDGILPPYWSRSNPVDLVGEFDPSIPLTVLEELLKWDQCDAVINLGIMGRWILMKRLGEAVMRVDPAYPPELMEPLKKDMFRFETEYAQRIVALMETYGKPVFGVKLLSEEREQTVYRFENQSFGAVFYETPERAVMAFAKMVEYKRFLERE